MKLHRLFYSEDQRMNGCCPEVLVDGEWKPYTEWTEGDDNTCNTNWLDAHIVYEGTDRPTTRYMRCGMCLDCEMLSEGF